MASVVDATKWSKISLPLKGGSGQGSSEICAWVTNAVLVALEVLAAAAAAAAVVAVCSDH